MVVHLFVKRLCKDVKQRWPDRKVVYTIWEMHPPKNVRFPDNLVVEMNLGSAMGLMGQSEVRAQWDQKIREWGAAVVLRVGSYSPSDWTYGPVQYPHVVQDFYRRHRDIVRGGWDATYGPAIRVTGAPTWYVWKRVLWNPDVDVDATLDEMCKRLFGPGADAARELLHLECDRWEKTPLSRPLSKSNALPPGQSACRIPGDLFREIWPMDVVAKMKSLRDKALLDICAAGDTAARQAFLYWTWTFDAFLKDAQEIHLKANPLPTLTLDLGNGVDLKLVRIPAGEFLMGSPPDELWRREHEGPQHLVRLTKPFYIGVYEVTQSQWEAVTGVKFAIVNNKGVGSARVPGFTGPDRHVGATWEGAEDFCRKMSQKTGRTVRLPTEAQWEYACRAGSATAWCFGDYCGALGRYAVFDNQGYGVIEEDSGPQDVGRKRPNVWGLYDMHGNASELVRDWYSDTYYKDSPTDDPTGPTSGIYRVRRGGSWCSHLALTRSAIDGSTVVVRARPVQTPGLSLAGSVSAPVKPAGWIR
jgi:formylglycine-generating enzyme required for sulfatase activity